MTHEGGGVNIALEFLSTPKDAPHAFTVDVRSARLLFIFTPAGFEDLIKEMEEPARELTIPPQPEEPPSEAEMQQIADASDEARTVQCLSPI